MLRVKSVLDGCAEEELLEGREGEEEGLMSQQMSASMATSMATEAEGRAAGGGPEAGEVVQGAAPRLLSPVGAWQPCLRLAPRALRPWHALSALLRDLGSADDDAPGAATSAGRPAHHRPPPCPAAPHLQQPSRAQTT
jgi:hypothetical protein